MSERALIFLVIKPSAGTNIFLPCDLNLSVWPTLKNFNFPYNFWTVSARALIFIKSTPCDSAFQFLTLWPWPYTLTYILKRLNVLITFEQWGLWYFTWVIILTRPFCGYNRFDPVILTLEFGLLFENLNLVYNFWTVNVRALIFHINIPYDNFFNWY